MIYLVKAAPAMIGLVAAVLSESTAAAQSSTSNPDEGMLTRIVCYEPDETGDPRFMLILQQTSVNAQDASYFVPGNRNFDDVFTTGREEFSIHVNHYPAAITVPDGLSGEKRIRRFAEELLQGNPTLEVSSGWVARGSGVGYRFRNGEGARVRWNLALPEMQTTMVDGVHRNLTCLDPYGIPAS